MEILLVIAYSLLFFYFIRKNNFFKTDGDSVWPGIFFLLKCMAGISLGLIYTHYYTDHQDADTFKFFTDSKIMFDTLTSRPYDFFRMLTGYDAKSHDLRHYYMEMNAWLNKGPLYNDNRTMVRLNAFFRFFSLGHYYVHVVFINFISFAGLFCLYKTFISYCRNKKKEMLFLTFLMPSVVFWGSGLLKDSLLISGFGIFIFSYSRILKEGLSFRRIVFLAAGLLVLIFTKAYIIAIILPGLFAWLISKNWPGKKAVLTFILLYGVYLTVAFNLYHFRDEYNVAAFIFYKQRNFIEIGAEHAARMITPPVYECSGTSMLAHAPEAFFITMFRPFITDVHGNPMVLLSALENVILLLLFLAAAISFRKPESNAVPFFMLNLFLIILLFVLIGLITPILGAIVRYRIIALPSLAFILVSLYDRKKLIRYLPFLKFIEK